VISEATVVFDRGEQLAADLPSYPLGAEVLKQQFHFESVAAQQEAGVVFWIATKGQFRIGERTFRVDSAKGNLRMLGIGIEGTEAEAVDVLQELWTALRDATDSTFVPPLGQSEDRGQVKALGRLLIHTYAIVRLPFSASELFPQLAFLESELSSRVQNHEFKLSPDVRLRFACEVRLQWSGRTVAVPVVIEPRANEPLESRLFFTRSPLPLSEHMQLLEKFVERFKPQS
jgi:hypothetical protein